MANQYDLEILIRTKKQGDGIEQAGKGVENLGKRLNSTLDTVNKSVVAVAAAGATFKQAFDLAKEGAQLQFAQERFDKLSVSIGTTADALQNELRAATSGLVADSELITSATDIMSLGLAKDEEGVVRLAAVIGKLGLDMQQVILTFANNSTARLDALGLSVETVTAKAAELEAQGFDGDAFDQAVLISLEEKLALVGDAADSDVAAFLRLEAQAQNAEDAFKSWLANGLLPVIEAVSGGYDQQIEKMIDNNVEAAKSFDELVAEAQKMDDAANILGGLGTAVTGTSGAFREGIVDISRQLAGGANSFEDFEAVVGNWSAKSQQSLYSYLRANDLTLEGFYELEQQFERVNNASNDFSTSLEELSRLGREYSVVTGTSAVGAASDYGAELARLSQLGQEAAASSRDNIAAIEAEAAARRSAFVDSFNAAADPVNELLSAQQALADSQGEWVERTVSTAGQVSAVNAQLASDLSDDQAKAYREILRTVDEGSAEWLDAYNRLQGDLSQSQRDALVAQQADLAAQPDRLASVYTGDAEGAEEAQARITAANEAIKQSYRETAAEILLAQAVQDGNLEQQLDVLVGIGYLTQAQADAQLEIANTNQAIQDLTASQEYSRLTTDEQTTALNSLIEGTAKTADEAVNLAEQQTAVNEALEAMPKAVVSTVTIRGLDEAGSRIGDLLRQLDDFDGRNVSATATVNTFTTGDLGSGGGDKEAPKKAAGGSVFAGGLYQVGEGNRPEFLRTPKGLFMIPGDDGQVFGNQQSQGMLGGSYEDRSQTVYNIGSDKTAALVVALTDARKRSRLDQYMGIR